MNRLSLALASLTFALGAAAASPVYIHRLALVFDPGSSELPPQALAVLTSLVEEAREKCGEGSVATIEVNELVQLPLGRVSAGPTLRTTKVAATLREVSKSALQPYEAALAPASNRVRILGLKENQVGVELSCPARTM